MVERSRHVDFEACFNFRDLGGYETLDGRHVRWHALYRSDTLHRLTPADAEEFDALGLRTVIDLRSHTELDDFGRLAVAGAHEWHHVPMLDDVKLALRGDAAAPEREAPPEELAPGEGYVRIVQQFGDALARVLDVLSRDDALPAVFHCTSGKDRTGIVAAVVLELLGVPDEVIAADYVLTTRARERSSAWIEANEPDFAAFLATIPPERRVVSEETILGFLAGVRAEHGGIRELVDSIGVTDAQVAALRERLLDA